MYTCLMRKIIPETPNRINRPVTSSFAPPVSIPPTYEYIIVAGNCPRPVATMNSRNEIDVNPAA